LRIHSWLPHGAPNGSNGWTRNLEAREFANGTAAHPLVEEQEVDWKRLVQFALPSSGDLEQYAIPMVRVSRTLSFSGISRPLVSGPARVLDPV
jgi:hypothetical protein